MDASTECGEARGLAKVTVVKSTIFLIRKQLQNLEAKMLGNYKISRRKYSAGVGDVFIN
jgi:hypothetical protein